jgi:hypothetical protein
MGHIFAKDGALVDSKKIEAMKDWPRPKNIKRLCGFNRVLSQICSELWKNCLTALLKKNDFA